MIRQGTMTPVLGRVCAMHHLPTARVLDQEGSGSNMFMFMKLFSDLQWLSHHIVDVVPQPAHKSHPVERSVERATGASYGTTGLVCKAVCDEADLVRRRSARRGLHREIVGGSEASTSRIGSHL